MHFQISYAGSPAFRVTRLPDGTCVKFVDVELWVAEQGMFGYHLTSGDHTADCGCTVAKNRSAFSLQACAQHADKLEGAITQFYYYS